MRRLGLGLVICAVSIAPRIAHAQSDNPNAPLPPLPPSSGAQPSTQPPSTPPSQPDAQSSQPDVEVAPEPTQPTIVVVAPPPNYYRRTTDAEFPEGKHAPKYSFYVGADLGVIGYGGSFFQNALNQPESTGNFVHSGLSFEIDAGARLGKRYIPYLVWEHAFLGDGARLDGTNAHASSDFVGIGFRLLAWDVDNVSFLTDLAIGFRSVTVANDSETFKMSSLEIGRLGLGAEIRLSTLFTLAPVARLSFGQMTDSSGGITYASNQGDGQTNVTFANGAINSIAREYIVVGLGCGAHFDFFGK